MSKSYRTSDFLARRADAAAKAAKDAARAERLARNGRDVAPAAARNIVLHFSLFGGLPTVTDTLASTSRGMSSNCVWALARRRTEDINRTFWRRLGAPALSQQRSPARRG